MHLTFLFIFYLLCGGKFDELMQIRQNFTPPNYYAVQYSKYTKYDTTNIYRVKETGPIFVQIYSDIHIHG